MDDTTKKLIDTYKAQGPLTTGQIGDVITSSSLQSVKPYSIPSVTPSTTAEGVSGLATSLSESTKANQQIIRDQEAKAAELQAKTSNTENQRSSLMDRILGVQSSRSALETEAKIGEKAQKVTDVTNQIDALERAKTNELRALETQGLTSTGAAAAAAGIQRKYAVQQADLAVIQSAANRDLATATSIIDRKIELQLEPLKMQYDFINEFYKENKADLSKEEDRLFQTKIKDSERAYEEAKTLQETIGKLQIQAASQGADPSIIQAIGRARTIGEASQAAGQYAGDILDRQYKQAQIAKAYADARQAQNTLPSSVQARVQGIAGQFDGEQAVKNYQTSAEAIDAMKNAAKTPTDDIGRIYAFAKVMDPNSVVREGEYATVQEYSTALLERTGLKAKRVFDNSGFLTDEARKFMLDTLENRLASSKKAYDNIYNSYGERINKVTGRNDGKDYITDYSAAFKDKAVQTVKSNGQEWIVGKVYNDGTSNWVVDANGKWSQQ